MFVLKCKCKLRAFPHISALSKPISRSYSEKLEPVKLSYATYESTNDADSGPPLVVMHGLFGSKSNWNSLCKAYQQKTSPQRKIIAVDGRNHGDSDRSENHTYAHLAADIKAFLDQLGIKKACLLGHSMGGRAVALFALKYPEYVERLIVGDISPFTTSPHLHHMPILIEAMESIALPKNISMSQARQAVDAQLAKSVDSKDLRSFLLTNLVRKEDGSYKWRVNLKVLNKTFNNVAGFPLVENMQYNGPTLFVGGGYSDFIPKSDYPKILKLFPKAELKYIDGAGHWLHAEKPTEFLNLTLEFLNRKISVS